jgi:hypothetical protein
VTASCSCGAKLFVYTLRPASNPGVMNIFSGREPHPVVRANSVEEALTIAEQAFPLPESQHYVVEAVRN